MFRRIAKLSLLLAVFIAAITNAFGQAFPTRPIHLIVPFAVGGTSDIYARLIAEELSTILRQPMIVQNMPGGNSITGTAVAARAVPDGYTLLLISQTHATLETLVSDKPYQLLNDFVPVAPINQADLLMIVPQALPVKNLEDFVNLAKARPRGLTFASSGPGSPSHMAGELFKTVSGIDMVHIPYKSAANARVDLLAGQLHVMFDAYPFAVQAVKSGQLRALATTGKRRSDTLPDVPTVRERGLEEFEAIQWTGIVAPSRTPRDIVQKLNEAISKAVLQPKLSSQWSLLGAEPIVMSTLEFGSFLRRDIQRWAQVAKISRLRVD